MKTYKTREEIRREITNLKNAGKSVGFVPTMGALHKGHISLVERSCKENKVTIASIFVNPNQFNNPEDLRNYPRMMNEDIALLEKAGCDILFAPDEKEVYPEPDTRIFEFGMLDKVMEGRFRPNHFNGVAQVVSRFFDIINPDNAYFGEKDYQQLVIIKKLAKQFNYNIKITGCPIIREDDGLAMSSRNLLLGKEERRNVPHIFQALTKAVSKAKEGATIGEVKTSLIDFISLYPCLKFEYFEIVDPDELTIATQWNSSRALVGCIAVYAGFVRLIDNIRFYL
ncbi:MAG: pantoate--beta-alanine ligase [Bacteroidia bacterium]|nr:pantoate--beta-alanine ligase [Bacteroidia bacterium]